MPITKIYIQIIAKGHIIKIIALWLRPPQVWSKKGQHITKYILAIINFVFIPGHNFWFESNIAFFNIKLTLQQKAQLTNLTYQDLHTHQDL